MELQFLDKSIEIIKTNFAENDEKLIQVFELVDDSFFIKSTLKKDNYEQYMMLSKESFEVLITLSSQFLSNFTKEQIIKIAEKFKFIEHIKDK